MKRLSIYVKMKVLSAVEFAPGITIRQRIVNVSKMSFADEDGVLHQFTWRTIQTWLYRFKLQGATALESKPRSDKGAVRKVQPENVQQAIEKLKARFHGKKLQLRILYRMAIEEGLLLPGEVSQTSFYRIVKAYDLLAPESQTENKKRLAFAKPFANDLWQADTMFGPHVQLPRNRQAKLIAFIDDASRVVAHGEFFLTEDVESLIAAFRTALYKRGIPKQIYVDNGSVYTSKEMNLICARLGILLSHAPVRDAAAKGKIERFFRTVRSSFLSQSLDLSSLDALNRQFIAWLEDRYNSTVHSSLAIKPVDRFGLDLSRIHFLSPGPANDELFFIEKDRAVAKTNTFQLNNIVFEPPVDLRAKKIQVRFNRKNFDPHHVAIYFNKERLGLASPIDYTANDRFKNTRRNNDNPTPLTQSTSINPNLQNHL